ncbi:unnamed protein product [Brassicogethes aeneus]|uniref:Uncharacterized protein n=1 Tax=Brassicogethes aeneus TaxID=1431903 RepID=A0A9P0AVN0_BRAAE|nr:unnamed protein product [Brassicogethes aeneus]
MELITTKIVVAVLFALGRFFFGTLPVKLYHFLRRWEEEDDSPNFVNEKRHNQVNCAIAMCQSFGGGVLFATCFLHMMVEVFKSVEDIKKLEGFNTDYPLSQIVVTIGFFFIYFLEEGCHWYIAKLPAEPCPSRQQKNNNLGSRTITPLIKTKVSPSMEKEDIFIIQESKNPEEITHVERNEETLSISSSVEKENKKNITLSQEIEIPDDFEGKKNQRQTEILHEFEKIFNSDSKTQQQIVRCIFIVMALSLHAIFEGLAIGLQNEIATIWYLFTAVTIHSATILFCMGLELLIAKTKTKTIILQMLLLAATSPFGVIIGLLITLKADMNTKAKSAAVVILEGLSTGTILYITFFEVLNREKARRVYRLYRGICIMGGFTFMALLQYYEILEKT